MLKVNKDKQDFAKSYTLTAQTPLIHFQSAQQGAALRATEVKPKLDRYLKKCAEKDEVDISAWLMPEHGSLNYKMRITAGEEHFEAAGINIKDCKHYFGDNDIVFRNFRLEIICFDEALMNYIDEKIGEFFILHNFGTRQSKGFGGFTVAEKKENIHNVISRNCDHFFFADVRGSSVKDRLNHSVCIYSIMKNGINQTRYQVDSGRYLKPKQYIKGFAVREYLDSDTGSDKAFIKSNVIMGKPRKFQSREPVEKYANYTFIRAILGLADHYEFRDDMRNNGSRTNFKGNLVYEKTTSHMLNFDGTVIENGLPTVPEKSLKGDKGIRRFRSPVTIKIFSDRMYFIFDESYKLMLGKIFHVLTDEENKNLKKAISSKRFNDAQAILREAKCICTPAVFDADKFIDGFIDYFGRNKAKLRDFYFIDKSGNIDIYSKTQYLTLKKGGAANV